MDYMGEIIGSIMCTAITHPVDLFSGELAVQVQGTSQEERREWRWRDGSLQPGIQSVGVLIRSLGK